MKGVREASSGLKHPNKYACLLDLGDISSEVALLLQKKKPTASREMTASV